MRNAPLLRCTVFDFSGLSLSFQASSATICLQDFATFAAYGDLATGLLAILALLTIRVRPLFWSLVVAFNLVGAIDIIVDYYHGVRLGLPALSGELGATYAIVIVYVPLLMITHFVSFYLLLRRQSEVTRAAIV